MANKFAQLCVAYERSQMFVEDELNGFSRQTRPGPFQFSCNLKLTSVIYLLRQVKFNATLALLPSILATNKK